MIRPRTSLTRSLFCLTVGATLLACGDPPDTTPPNAAHVERDSAWEAFRARALPGDEPGTFIVEGDLQLRSEEELFAYYDHYANGAPPRLDILKSLPELMAEDRRSPFFSTVHHPGSTDRVWDQDEKLWLTYCISNDFGGDKQKVVDAFERATNDYERAGHLNYVYVSEHDHDCERSNHDTDDVKITVELNPDAYYLARAFFPKDPESQWSIQISDSGMELGTTDFRGLVRHELGHTLGLRHEHIRNPVTCTPEEFTDARALTPFDPESVMHYDWCDGAVGDNNELTRYDVMGLRQLYNLPTHMWTAQFGGNPLRMRTDYNGDGRTDVGFVGPNPQVYYGQANGTFSVDNEGIGSGWSRMFSGIFRSTAGYSHDVMRYVPGPNGDSMIFSGPGTPTFTSSSRSVSGFYQPLIGQFSGTLSDILWYQPGNGSDPLWDQQNDGSHNNSYLSVNGYYIPLVGNFDGDADTDVFWYNPVDDTSPYWSSNGNGTFQSSSVSSPFLDDFGLPYTPLVGDFTGDGKDDIFWYRPGSANDLLWIADSSSPRGSVVAKSVSGRYRPFVGDFDGDGAMDIFWYAPGSGSESIWFFNSNGGHTSQSVPSIGGDYSPFVGNFDGDWDDDILWYRPEHTTSPRWISDGDGTFTTSWISTPLGHYPVGFGASN